MAFASPLPIGRPRAATRSRFAAAARPAYLLAGLVAVSTALLLRMRGLILVGADFEVLGTAAALLMVGAWCLHARGFVRTATFVETWTLMTTFCVVASILLFVLAAGRMPLIDGTLATADRLLLPALDWPAMVRSLGRDPVPVAAATFCYASLGWQPLLLLFVCVTHGRTMRCWTFVTAWVIALIVTSALFALLPAVGPYPHYAITQAAVPAMTDPAPWNTPGIVTGLRNGSLRAIAFTDLDGIVTFPSFHAGGAVLLAWGFWPLRPLRAPMVTLNAAMMLAAIPIGGHYFVDIPAGAAVAVLAILVARRWVPERSAAEHAGEDRVDVLEVIVEVEPRGDLVRG